MPADAERHATEVYELLGALAEYLVFVLVGGVASLTAAREGTRFGLYSFLLCLLGRGVVVPVCSLASNLGKAFIAGSDDREIPTFITWRHQVMMWLGGLRGGVSLVLALELNTAWCPRSQKAIITEGTFIVIVMLLITCGGSTEYVLNALGMVDADEESDMVDALDAESPQGAAATQQQVAAAASLRRVQQQRAESPRSRLANQRRSSFSSRTDKEAMREQRDPFLGSPRPWGKMLVDFFEPIILGDPEDLQRVVARGAQLHCVKP